MRLVNLAALRSNIDNQLFMIIDENCVGKYAHLLVDILILPLSIYLDIVIKYWSLLFPTSW